MISFAIDTYTFVFGTALWSQLCTLNEDWSIVSLTDLNLGRRVLGHELLKKLAKKQSNLPRIRTGTPGDFKLVSNEGESVEVHTVVLAPLWPFFEAAATSDMKEANDKSLKLQCSTPTLEVIVRFFYEQDLELKFAQAADLIVVAQMYDLSDLLDIAVSKIKSQTMTAEECLIAWEKCQEAKNEDLRKDCASKMKLMMSGIVGSSERIDKMAKEDLLVLFMDVSNLFV